MSSNVAIRLGADNREATILVRIEPRQVEVRAEPGRKAQEAEHDVLDALAYVGFAVGDRFQRLLAGQVQQHRDVVCAEAPECVLIRPQLAEVQAVAVDVVDAVAQLAGVEQLLELLHAGVILEQVADHQKPAAGAGGCQRALGVGHRLRERLLDKAVLARLQRALRKTSMGRHRRRDHDGVQTSVVEQLVELRRHARGGKPLGDQLASVR